MASNTEDAMIASGGSDVSTSACPDRSALAQPCIFVLLQVMAIIEAALHPTRDTMLLESADDGPGAEGSPTPR